MRARTWVLFAQPTWVRAQTRPSSRPADVPPARTASTSSLAQKRLGFAQAARLRLSVDPRGKQQMADTRRQVSVITCWGAGYRRGGTARLFPG